MSTEPNPDSVKLFSVRPYMTPVYVNQFSMLKGQLHFNSTMRLVANQFEVICPEVVDILDTSSDLENWKPTRRPLQLLTERFNVGQIDVSVAQGMYELARPEPGHVSHHARQQGVTGDVEWNAEAHVAGTLVEQARQLGTAGDVELG